MSVMTLKRSASTFRIAALPRTRRPSGSGPRAIKKVASSAKNVMMRSTSRVLNASLIAFISVGVGPPAIVCVVIACPPVTIELSSWTHRMHRGPGPPAGCGELGPLAEQPARVARIDDLLDPERLGRAERGAQLRQPLLDLGHLLLRIWRGVDVRAVCGLDAAFERQRAPTPRRPRVARAVATTVAVRGARHAEAVANDHRAPRNGRLPDGRHRAHALLDRARALRVEPDQEPGAVDQIDHRQVERLRDVDEALNLLAGVRCPRAAVE